MRPSVLRSILRIPSTEYVHAACFELEFLGQAILRKPDCTKGLSLPIPYLCNNLPRIRECCRVTIMIDIEEAFNPFRRSQRDAQWELWCEPDEKMSACLYPRRSK